MNKPFTLVLSVPHKAAMSVIFPLMMIEANIFPVHRDNEVMHTTVVDELTDMMCNAMDPYFMVTTEIQNGICLIVENSHKRDATGIKFFSIS